MALLERRELLERQRVDPAEGAPARARPVRSRFSCSSRTKGAGSGCSASGSGARARRRAARGWSGPNSVDEHVGVDAELLDGLGLELLDAQPLLGAGDLVAVHGVGELAQLGLQPAQRRARSDRGRCSRSVRAASAAVALPAASAAERRDSRSRARPQRRARPRATAPRAGGGPAARRPAAGAAARGGALRSSASARSLQGASPLLARCAGRAAPPSRRCGPLAARRRGGRGRRWTGRPRSRSSPGPPRAAPASAACSVLVGRDARRVGLGDGLLGALDLGRRGCARTAPSAAELLGDGGHPGVGLVQPLEGGLDAGPIGAGAACGGGEREAGAQLARWPSRHPALVASVDRGLHLEQARRRGCCRRGPCPGRRRRRRG